MNNQQLGLARTAAMVPRSVLARLAHVHCIVRILPVAGRCNARVVLIGVLWAWAGRQAARAILTPPLAC